MKLNILYRVVFFLVPVAEVVVDFLVVLRFRFAGALRFLVVFLFVVVVFLLDEVVRGRRTAPTPAATRLIVRSITCRIRTFSIVLGKESSNGLLNLKKTHFKW